MTSHCSNYFRFEEHGLPSLADAAGLMATPRLGLGLFTSALFAVVIADDVTHSCGRRQGIIYNLQQKLKASTVDTRVLTAMAGVRLLLTCTDIIIN